MNLFFDCETTTFNKGNPFDTRNQLVCIGWITDDGTRGIWFAGQPEDSIRSAISASGRLVGFNAKFDLHWLRKCFGSEVVVGKQVFCCQVAEFFLNGQFPQYPDLDSTAAKYGIPGKFDRVKSDYWDKGIDTRDIPRNVLSEYCLQDVNCTREVYLKQQERVTPENRVLLSLEMQDLLVLEDIEWNGLYFNPSVVQKKKEKLDTEIQQIQAKLGAFHNCPVFNWSSPAHVSALLYGGDIVEERRVPIGVFKSGKKVGQPRYAVERVTHTLPRMYKPPKGSELAKEGQWSTDEDTLMKIKGGKKELIEGILRSKELSKLQSTYVGGLLEKHNEMHWPKNYIHGQYNQVVAATGRLSSSNPNMQNMTEAVSDMFETRFQ